MALKQVPPLDLAWLVLESRDTPMHVGGLFEFTLPDDAPPDYLKRELERMRQADRIPSPWNLKLVEGPIIGPRLPLMTEDRDLDLDYHIRHSALPHPGGQRELGILVSRLHSHQLDLHRPLWEVHLIEGLEGNRFAMYSKIHHSLIDGVSGMRLIMRALSTDPGERGMSSFWTVGAGSKARRERSGPSDPVSRLARTATQQVKGITGLGRAAVDLTRAAVDGRALQAPYRTPASQLKSRLGGQRRFATQQYDLALIKAMSKAAECSLNDVVLYLCGTALRSYLLEHGQLPDRPLSAGIPVNLRAADDESTGTAIGIMVAEMGTNISNPRERLDAIKRSTAEAKRHLADLPPESRMSYTLVINGPWIAGLMAGLGVHAPVPFSAGISNVPGPTERLYFNGSRLDALFPLSLLMHGNALNITCVSYSGTLNFGFTGARDQLPHLQHLAIFMGEAVSELKGILLPGWEAAVEEAQDAASGNGRPAAEPSEPGRVS